MKKTKALVLLSGGLDSQIAVKILEEQGIEVEAICFTSNFYNAEKAKIAAKNLGIKLHIVNIEKEMVDLVKSPPSGYGKNMNPCIDCHAMMIRLAKEFACKLKNEEKEAQPLSTEAVHSASPLRLRSEQTGQAERGRAFRDGWIIATGEVLGQRPFSQNRRSLRRVEELSGVEVLRPLSAKLLDETSYEKTRIILRHKLLDIEGRQREKQIELAKKYGIKDYPTPSGGCLLTDPGFSERLLFMINRWPECSNNDIELLKHGRMLWVKKMENPSASLRTASWVLAIIGRHQEDNEKLTSLSKQGDVIIELDGIEGPTSVIRELNPPRQASPDHPSQEGNLKIGEDIKLDIPEKLKMGELGVDKEKSEEEILRTAGLLTGWYAVKARGKSVKLKITIV